jgi:hypothetical protein
MNYATTKIKGATTKFDTLTYVENGLILKYGKKRERTISFTELDNIYVKVYKIKPVFEFAFILFPFLPVFLTIQYLPFDVVLFVAMFTVIPVFVKVNNDKWYRLNIHLNDGTFFRKRVPLRLKSENISIVNAIRSRSFLP